MTEAVPDVRPTWGEVDLGAVRANTRRLASLADPAALLAVVKADGYGHGAVPVARAALEAGASWLGVALVEEGTALRAAGLEAPILVLSEPPAGIEKSIIEIAPIAFMRGRTLNDAFVILDEAQNTTSEQMKMFLTRLGFNSKAVMTGDVTQIDLPNGRRSGLVEAVEVVGKVTGISMIYFTERDVVRHSLVQRIIRAYEEFDQVRAAKANGEKSSG